MAIGRVQAVAEKIVQQHKLLGQSMMVGGDLAAKDTERGIALATGQIARGFDRRLCFLLTTKTTCSNIDGSPTRAGRGTGASRALAFSRAWSA